VVSKKLGSRRAPTESDVAKLAGVSQSAVSRAYTKGASIAQKTREKILQAAKELGYQPNLMARSLATNQSNIIALAISNLENPFYANVAQQLSSQLREIGKHILLFTSPSDDETDPMLERALSYQVDALIMTATMASPELALQCKKAGVPIVQINRGSKIAGVSTVWGENHRAGEVAAEHLLKTKHKKFAFVAGSKTSSTSQMRQDGFIEHLAKSGIKNVPIEYGEYSFSGAANAARKLLSTKNRPDAIFCASDYMAFSVLDVAKREFNLNVPNEVSIIGVDDVPEASHLAYDLTTFSQPAGALAKAAIEIVEKMNSESSRRAMHIEVEGQLIIRGSTKL